MKLKLKATKLEDGDWLAQADSSFNFDVGFPGAIAYGDSEDEARLKLKDYLTQNGYEVITDEDAHEAGEPH